MIRKKGESNTMGQELSSGDAAKYLGIHPHTLRRYMDAKLLHPARNALTGHLLFRTAELDALKKRAERHGPPLMRLRRRP